jgi:hypothetical protein
MHKEVRYAKDGKSITLTDPNGAWLREHVEGTQDYGAKGI